MALLYQSNLDSQRLCDLLGISQPSWGQRWDKTLFTPCCDRTIGDKRLHTKESLRRQTPTTTITPRPSVERELTDAEARLGVMPMAALTVQGGCVTLLTAVGTAPPGTGLLADGGGKDDLDLLDFLCEVQPCGERT